MTSSFVVHLCEHRAILAVVGREWSRSSTLLDG